MKDLDNDKEINSQQRIKQFVIKEKKKLLKIHSYTRSLCSYEVTYYYYYYYYYY